LQGIFFKVLINILGNFTDDFEIPHDRIDPHLIFQEFLITHLTGIVTDTSSRFGDIIEIEQL
jgi:hypothetical protein